MTTGTGFKFAFGSGHGKFLQLNGVAAYASFAAEKSQKTSQGRLPTNQGLFIGQQPGTRKSTQQCVYTPGCFLHLLPRHRNRNSQR